MAWDPDNINANVTLSNGNRTATANSDGTDRTAISVEYKTTGKWYWEIEADVIGTSPYQSYGICHADVDFTKNTRSGYNESWAYMANNRLYHDGSYNNCSYTVPSNNDILSFAVDIDNGKLWFGVNDVWQQGDPAAGTDPSFEDTTVSGQNMYVCYTHRYSGDQCTTQFDSTQTSYTPPTGFTSLTISFVGYFSGYVYEQGSSIQRTLYLHNRSDGSLEDSTTSSGNGYYYLETTYSGAHYIVCLDDPAGEDYNDLILGNVIPTTVSG